MKERGAEARPCSDGGSVLCLVLSTNGVRTYMRGRISILEVTEGRATEDIPVLDGHPGGRVYLDPRCIVYEMTRGRPVVYDPRSNTRPPWELVTYLRRHPEWPPIRETPQA